MKDKTHNFSRKRPLQLVLVNGVPYNTSYLRHRLLREGLKERKCEGCNLTEWMGRPIPLELNHKNGMPTDNRLENLELLCPSCHAFTDNYRGKNIGIGRRDGREKTTKRVMQRQRPTPTCPHCGIAISRKAHRWRSCEARHRVHPTKIEWPANEWLIEQIQKKSYTQLARELGVSNKAIRKHLAGVAK